MYAKSFDDIERVSFRPSEHPLPANYRGTAFSDSRNQAAFQNIAGKETEPPCGSVESDTDRESFSGSTADVIPADADKTVKSEKCDGIQPLRKKLLDSDTLLLLGLIFLFINADKADAERNSDEILLILLVLLISGF